MKNLSEIKVEVDRQAALLGAIDNYSLPTYGRSEDGARPYVEIDSLGYHLVVIERDIELSRLTTIDLDVLLYKIFENVTFSLACNYELANRIQGQDSRRILFQRQIELLLILSSSWGERRAQEHKSILQKYPFDDSSSLRINLSEELRLKGHPALIAWKMACEQYPPLSK